jgi:hypothetical protein
LGRKLHEGSNPSLSANFSPALTMVASRRHKISEEFRGKFGRYFDELRFAGILERVGKDAS